MWLPLPPQAGMPTSSAHDLYHFEAKAFLV
jgi:hypothetical protein